MNERQTHTAAEALPGVFSGGRNAPATKNNAPPRYRLLIIALCFNLMDFLVPFKRTP